MQGEQGWIAQFSNAELNELDNTIKGLATHYENPVGVSHKDFSMPLLEAKFKAIRIELEDGRGFQVLRGLPVERYSLEQSKIMLWALSLLLGSPQEQDRAGNLMHSVVNTGKKVTANSSTRGYETDDELTFHNDGGDAFMLLCLKTAVSGGVSKLVSVSQLFNEILLRDPQLAKVLQEPFYFDTRSQHKDGRQTQASPIMNFFEGKLSALYKRQYIETAQRFPNTPRLTKEQIEAIDLIDELCNDPSIQLSFSMQPGDVQIGNNYSIFHARTKYQDHAEDSLKRHLLRTWITLPNGRSLPPIFAQTREFSTSYTRRLAA
ncbi:hypothetical protein GCM10027278_22720 [Paralcaligenes ginsengisoli]